jgi:hypothetical protein
MPDCKESNNSLCNQEFKAWVISATMGYGHHRAVFPFEDIAEGGIITDGSGQTSSKKEERLWKRFLGAYEFLSRAKSLPIVGKPIFSVLDSMLHIPSYYPIRDLSNSTFQVDFLVSTIRKGLCASMLEKISTKDIPILTSFYASAIAADMKGFQNVYCVICDADINRVWVAKEPWESSIHYFAPCGKAAQRLRSYGVPDERISITGFPLPLNLLGDKNLSVLKSDLGKRLRRLDPNGHFWLRHGKNAEHFLGIENCNENVSSKLTIMYAVGGAGALKEIGAKIAVSLKDKILNGSVSLILVAGTKSNVRDYFLSVRKSISADDSMIKIIYSETIYDYFKMFNEELHNTDILWTKPSELSFYSALGIPIVMTPPIGSQEKFNKKWLNEIRAATKQEKPEYTDQWLFELLNKGILAETAWSGFLKARKLGTYNIMEVLKTGKMSLEQSHVLR